MSQPHESDRLPLERLSMLAWLKELRGYHRAQLDLLKDDSVQDWIDWGEKQRWLLEGARAPKPLMDSLKAGFDRLAGLQARLRRVGGDSHGAKLHRAKINFRMAMHNCCWLVTRALVRDQQWVEADFDLAATAVALRNVVDWLVRLQTAPPAVPGWFQRR